MKKTTKPVDGVVSASRQSANPRFAKPASGQASSQRRRHFGSRQNGSLRREASGQARKRTGNTSIQQSSPQREVTEVVGQIQANKGASKTAASSGYKKSSRRSRKANEVQPRSESRLNLEENKNALRIIPLGGQEEVGRNMTVFEYGGDIVILDMGLMFPEEDMPGIDYIIPNASYLKGKEKNIRGVILSHGHLIISGPLLFFSKN